MCRHPKDLTGQPFGDLVVLRFHGALRPDSKKDKKLAWVCQCKCGQEVIVRSGQLNCKNHQSSCFDCARKNNGLKYSNLIGEKFGRLEVMSKAERPNVKNGSQYWNVVCDCGTKKIVSTAALKKDTVSCGCFKKENASKIHTTHGLSRNYGLYNKMRRSDPCERMKHSVGVAVRSYFKAIDKIKKGSVWDALPYTPIQLREHIEAQWESWMTWENYGGRPNSLVKTWWIDHIIPQDSFYFEDMASSGFLECWSLSNLRPLEKKANMSKGNKIL